MRRSVLALILVLAVPAPAAAATVSRTGSEIVLRSSPGETDAFEVITSADRSTVRFVNRSLGVTVSPGAGCASEGPHPGTAPGFTDPEDIACDAHGVALVRLLLGDGNDDLRISDGLPVAADLGPGNDRLRVEVTEDELYRGVQLPADLPAATIAGGDGNDNIDVLARTGAITGGAGDDTLVGGARARAGRWRIDGGAGRDSILPSRGGPMRVSGGRGNDSLVTRQGLTDTLDCGAGADTASFDLTDHLNSSCGPRVSGLRSGGVFARYAAGRIELTRGRLSGPGRVRVYVLRRSGQDQGDQLVRSGGLREGPGRLRGSIPVRSKAAAWLRRHKTVWVILEIRPRHGGGVEYTRFPARLS